MIQGSHENYGKAEDCLRVTVRLYEDDRLFVSNLAVLLGVSYGDAILHLIRSAQKQEPVREIA